MHDIIGTRFTFTFLSNVVQISETGPNWSKLVLKCYMYLSSSSRIKGNFWDTLYKTPLLLPFRQPWYPQVLKHHFRSGSGVCIQWQRKGCWHILLYCGHTSYLPRTHGRCPCKFFLDGVNFYRFNAKNWHFRQILREKVAFFTDLTRKIGVFRCKFYSPKILPV